MERRCLLAAVGTAACGLAGCLSASDGDDEIEYETCPNTIVRVGSLPDPAEEEVTTALEDGSYETEDELTLTDAIAVDESYLRWRDEYYAAEIEADGDVIRLRLAEASPPADPVWIKNGTDEAVTLEVRIEYEGELLLKRTVSVSTDDSVSLDGPDYRFGSYHAVLEVPARSERVVENWTVDESRFQAFVQIDADEMRVAQGAPQVATCEWSEDGALVDS